MMKCLITGASGLIGHEVLLNLQGEKDYEIHAVIRDPKKQITEISNCSWIHMDINQNLDFNQLPQKIDTVIHLAQSEHHRHFPEYALELFTVNTTSTAKLLEYARTAGAKKFVLVSSGGVYGNSENRFSESKKLELEPMGYYLGTKLCSEILARAYEQFFNVIVLRPFFVYGKNQRPDMLIPRLINSVKTKQSIMLEGENGIYINPTHVSDAAKSIAAAILLNESRTINIGGPEVLSLRDICNIIGEMIHCEPVYHVAKATGKDCIGEINEMQKWLWNPVVLFKEGIKSMLKE